MKRGLVATLAMAMLLLLGTAGPGQAMMGGHGRIGFHRHRGFIAHRPFIHHRFRGHFGFRAGIFVGPDFWWGPPWWGPAYPAYAAPPVVVQEAPPTYVSPGAQSPSYWYYCPNPAGYYPYIRECPSGWLTVVPPAGPPPQ